jgi:diguanylate cyclase (GGDEF)-like protein
MAAALQEGLRPYDLCVRYAGDEFIVVLSECTRETVEAKRVELQQRASRIAIEVRPGKTIRLGASAGAAVFPHDGTTYEALLADADSRMYREKARRKRASANQPAEEAGVPGVPGASAELVLPSPGR